MDLICPVCLCLQSIQYARNDDPSLAVVVSQHNSVGEQLEIQ